MGKSLPTGRGCRTTTGDTPAQPRREPLPGRGTGPLETLPSRAAVNQIEVGRRPLSVFDELTGTAGTQVANAACISLMGENHRPDGT